MKKLLHIYSPTINHSNSYVVGTRASLERLRDQIDETLLHEKSTSSGHWCAEQGFSMFVVCANPTEFDNLGFPYVNKTENLESLPKDGMHPSRLIPIKEHLKLIQSAQKELENESV